MLSKAKRHAARVALMGTTAANNRWRDYLIPLLVKLGVLKEDIFDPRVSDWNDEAFENEEFQKENAGLLVFYLGHAGDGKTSDFSLVETGVRASTHAESMLVILDSTALGSHAVKVLKNTKKLLEKEFPELVVVESVGAGLWWLVNKLNLQVELAEYALEQAADTIDRQLEEAHTGFTPDRVAREAIKAEQELIDQGIAFVERAIKESPYEREWDFQSGEYRFPDLTVEGLKVVAGHFVSQGWTRSYWSPSDYAFSLRGPS